MDSVTLSSKYHIVIPREVRQSLRLRPGQKFQVFEIEDRIEIVPVRKIGKMRGFAKGMDTTVEREKDRA